MLFAGALLPLALAPFDWWWFAPLPLLAYLWLSQNISCRRRYWRSFLFGLGCYGTGASWIYVSVHEYGPAPAPLAALLIFLFSCFMALLFLIPMWCWHRFIQDKPLGIAIGFPAAWMLDEWFRSWILTGFPWLFIGYSQTNTFMGNWAPVTGVYGISFWLALLTSTLFIALQQRKLFWAPVLTLVLAATGAITLGKIEWTNAVPGLQQPFALIQGNVPQQMKWKPEQRQAIRALYRDMSTPFWQKNTLVVWPEAAIPELYTPEHPYFSAIDEQLKNNGGALITGVPSAHVEADGTRVFHNSMLGLGEASGFYHKQRLVPFGEYVPLQKWLEGLLDFFKMPISDFQVGPANQPNMNSGIMSIASSICYEIAYPELVAAQAGDADFLLTVSNDTWFGASIGPHQHLQMAQMRARENAREMLRATSNGISAFIDRKGEIISRSPQFERFILQGTVQAYRGHTPYQQFGNWPMLVLCTGLLLITRLINRFASHFKNIR
ncbi:MAG TPA: apolipoprotein N-acyltransferase [Pseudomonadales bacterium]|nr:apolipoprotein N-acyltransferase [Pseudomonadales bacterium]